MKLDRKGERCFGVEGSKNVYGLGEEMMIREMKKELSYKKFTQNKNDAENNDEINKDGICVLCGNKKGNYSHMEKNICSKCIEGLKKGNFEKNDE